MVCYVSSAVVFVLKDNFVLSSAKCIALFIMNDVVSKKDIESSGACVTGKVSFAENRNNKVNHHYTTATLPT